MTSCGEGWRCGFFRDLASSDCQVLSINETKKWKRGGSGVDGDKDKVGWRMDKLKLSRVYGFNEVEILTSV